MAKDITDRLTKSVLAQRSATYRWLHENRDKIVAVFATQVRRPWKAIANTAAESGVKCTPDTLRKAWLRLEEDLARQATPVGSSPRPPSTPTRQTPRARPSEPPPTDDDDDNEPAPKKYNWTPSKPK